MFLLADVRTNATESDVRTALVLVFVIACAALEVILHILPAAAFDHFALQLIRVALARHICVVRVVVMYDGTCCW